VPVIICPACGMLLSAHSRRPGGAGRCPDCRAADRRAAGLWTLAAAWALVGLTVAATLCRHLP
jgi:hypothetical protein